MVGACHIDRQTLINAQKHPDEYRDLIVRVAGYSDHFRNLDKALQDEIIERTEQSFLLKNVREGSRQAAFSVIITKYEEVILMKNSGDCQSGISDSVCVADSDTFCSGRKDYRVFCSGSGTDRDRHYYTDDSK